LTRKPGKRITPSDLRPSLPPWAEVTPDRVEHIERVARLLAAWAEAMGVPDNERNRWLRAAWLHDALRDAPAAELEKWAPPMGRSAILLHGPAAASRAKADGETDRGVLDAVRYHSVGLAEWDMVGRALYCADFLEPGRKTLVEERAELASRFPRDPGGVLRSAAQMRIGRAIASGLPLSEPTVRFWNSLQPSAAG
jgi:HD superfamily phosphohydrolase YqeK